VTGVADRELMRLLQLCSAGLPVGGFTYSQGLEWAVEQGWVATEADLGDWLTDLARSTLAQVEIPCLVRLYQACQRDDAQALTYWIDWLLANRETRELREEERNRGRALASLLVALDVPAARCWRSSLDRCQSAGFALAACSWHIPLTQTAQGFAWAWLEGLVMAGVKLIPLGQSAGQRLLRDLAEEAVLAVAHGVDLADEAMGASAPALAIASSCHETQYTRLFRS
jgi:urease accessory protein